MESSGNNYEQQINNLEQRQNEAKIAHEVYVSRRKIWVSTLLCLISFVAPYIYTRRWKPLGAMVGGLFFLGCLIGDNNADFETNFQKGQQLSPILMVLAAIDNGVAIKKNQMKVKKNSSEPSLD
ncbi:MAG: hypothetical protein ACFCAD_11435 [Pleurocapsa sp.]